MRNLKRSLTLIISALLVISLLNINDTDITSRALEDEDTDSMQIDSGDYCMHGKTYGEKCEECKQLKLDQGDYELADGEEWDDPLIYGIELMRSTSSRGYKSTTCPLCGAEFSYSGAGQCYYSMPGSNQTCSDKYLGYCRNWYITVYASGTCKSHTHKFKCDCGHSSPKVRQSGGSYSCSYSWVTTKSATCLTEGSESYKCKDCYDVSSTRAISMKAHNVDSTTYIDSNQHLAHCSGNGTSAHDIGNVDHTFVNIGEDWYCSSKDLGCTAAKTNLHLDAYDSKTGDLIKSDIIGVQQLEVGNNGAEAIKLSSYINNVPDSIEESTISANQPDLDIDVAVEAGGIHLKVYYETENNQEFSVYVPKTIKVNISKSGKVTLGDNYKIINASPEVGTDITSIKFDSLGDWTIVSFNSDKSTFDSGKNIAIKINGCEVNTDGTVELTDQFKNISANGELKLDFDFKASKQTETFNGSAFDMAITVDISK